MSGLEDFTKRLGNSCVVIFTANLLLGGTSETHQMVAGDAALPRIKPRELDRFRNGFVVNDNCRRGEWFLGPARINYECHQEREKKTPMFHLQAELEPVIGDVRPGWKTRFGRLRQFVSDVGEISFGRSQASCDGESLVDAQVCRVRLVPQRV